MDLDKAVDRETGFHMPLGIEGNLKTQKRNPQKFWGLLRILRGF
jgi:hypothetical protein